jgi:hypothetical protein
MAQLDTISQAIHSAIPVLDGQTIITQQTVTPHACGIVNEELAIAKN